MRVVLEVASGKVWLVLSHHRPSVVDKCTTKELNFFLFFCDFRAGVHAYLQVIALSERFRELAVFNHPPNALASTSS